MGAVLSGDLSSATKQKACYMRHDNQGCAVRCLRFCPYEDVLALGHSEGLSTMLVPGCAEPNFDSYVANPYQTAKERREQEVHQLLDKLQPDMIVLNPDSIGSVRCSSLLPKLQGSTCPSG